MVANSCICSTPGEANVFPLLLLLQDGTLFPVSMVAGKKTAWNVWEAFPELTDVFARLSLGSADTADCCEITKQ